MNPIRSFIAHLVMFVMTVLSVGMPAMATAATSTTEWISPAPVGAALGTWPAHAADAANWVNFAGTNMPVPRDNWNTLGTAVWDKSGGFDLNMIQGERWITLARADAGRMGLTSQEISDRMQSFPANSAYVFASYSPENGQLSIEVHRIEKRPNGIIYIDQADFTPWHGEKWKAAGKYRTRTEIDFARQGYNPFENFKGDSVTDKVFYNIGWSGAQVAIGHAMRHYGAIMGFIAVSQSRVDQKVKKSGSLIKQKVKQTVTGFAKPDWYIATPVEMQREGAQVASICVSDVATTTATAGCDAPEHVAISGVAVTQWKGGNMPTDEEKVYEWVQTKTSFTVIFFSIILAVVTWGVATALVGPALAAGGAAAGGATAFGSSALVAGLAAGAIHAVASVALHGGGLTSAQGAFFGDTGNGVLNFDLSSLSVQSQGLAAAVRNRHIQSAQGHKLVGATKLYSGACPEDKTVAECNGLGLDAGQMWRGDAYNEVNMTIQMRQKYAECAGLGHTGAALMRCAAPNADAWPAN